MVKIEKLFSKELSKGMILLKNETLLGKNILIGYF